MRILDIATKQIYEIDAKKGGENQMQCPVCAKSRKQENQKKKPFSFNAGSGVGQCMNCGAKFVEYKPFKEEKAYVVPEWKNITDLSDTAVNYFAGRGISQPTLKEMRVYTDRHYFPQLEMETESICFPYFRDGKLVNVKYRGKLKSFSVVKDAELIFWNFDALYENKTIVIVEGEIDLLSCVEAGINNVISVPNGAMNTEYIDACIDLLNQMERVIICNDQDIPGITLRDELIRRIGEEKCCTVDIGTCKDANEYLTTYGGFELASRIKEAKEIPISGIINLSEKYIDTYNLYIEGMKRGLTVDVGEIDNMITWETKRLAVVTGIPSHGKSEFVDYIVTRLNNIHGYKVGYFSPENYPVQYHITKLISKISGKDCKPDVLSDDEFKNTYQYVQDNFSWIYPEENFTIETILEKARQLVKNKGIKILVIDPYNKLDHKLERGENKTDYVSRLLDRLIEFGKKYDCLVFLIAHPTKMKKTDAGVYDVPTLYDIADSANFYNKADFGLCVYRDFTKGTVGIYVQKVKFKHLGEGGMCELLYNYRNGRYETVQDINKWKYTSWIIDNDHAVEKPHALTPSTSFGDQIFDTADVKDSAPF